MKRILVFLLASLVPTTSWSYLSNSVQRSHVSFTSRPVAPFLTTTSLHLDANVLQGGAIALAGMVAGIALVAFTEERGKRGNLSENMATRIAGSLMEDVEVSSVSDLGGLTSQLEKALRESGSIEEEGLVQVLSVSEEEKKKKAEEADDGW